MSRLRQFIGLTLLGGLTVVLPITIFLILFNWLFAVLSEAMSPLTALISERARVQEALAVFVVLGLVLAGCFLIGLLVKTGVGGWLHRQVDRWLDRLAPGYKTIRELVRQILGGGDSGSLLTGPVVRVSLYGADNPVTTTGIVTSRNSDGTVTVFVPFGVLPPTGLIYHLPENCVQVLQGVSVEAVMRTVVACGGGSGELLAAPTVPLTDATAGSSPPSPAPR